MPSNKDLAAEAEALAQELELEVDTKDLNNKQLNDLVSDLKAKKTDGEKDTQADKPSMAVPRKPAKEAPAEDSKPEFVIAPGKAITSKRGILDAGSEVREDDFSAEAFKNFYDRKYIVRG